MPARLRSFLPTLLLETSPAACLCHAALPARQALRTPHCAACRRTCLPDSPARRSISCQPPVARRLLLLLFRGGFLVLLFLADDFGLDAALGAGHCFLLNVRRDALRHHSFAVPG